MAKESRNDKRVARHQRIRKNLYGTPRSQGFVFLEVIRTLQFRLSTM